MNECSSAEHRRDYMSSDAGRNGPIPSAPTASPRVKHRVARHGSTGAVLSGGGMAVVQRVDPDIRPNGRCFVCGGAAAAGGGGSAGLLRAPWRCPGHGGRARKRATRARVIRRRRSSRHRSAPHVTCRPVRTDGIWRCRPDSAGMRPCAASGPAPSARAGRALAPRTPRQGTSPIPADPAQAVRRPSFPSAERRHSHSIVDTSRPFARYAASYAQLPVTPANLPVPPRNSMLPAPPAPSPTPPARLFESEYSFSPAAVTDVHGASTSNPAADLLP